MKLKKKKLESDINIVLISKTIYYMAYMFMIYEHMWMFDNLIMLIWTCTVVNIYIKMY